MNQPAQAAACYSACIALHPAFHGWYFRRGLAHLRQGQHPLACADFDEAVRLRPGHAETFVNRALARMGAGRCAQIAASASPPRADPVNPAAAIAGCCSSLTPASTPYTMANVPSGAPAPASAPATT